jgi:hypothetical protein
MSRDDRRRRVLTEELLGSANDNTDAVMPAPRPVAAGRVKERSFMDRQPRITDLVPSRLGVIALLLFLGAAAIAGLEALYYYMPRWAEHTSDGRIAAFDLDGEGSLGAWFSSVSLGCASLLSLVILSVRRQKADDYHGRYRVWFWAALLFFAMSVDEAASLHEGFKEMMTFLTGHRLAGDGSLWWVIAYLLVGGVIGLRVMLDIRRSRTATTVMIMAAIAYAAAVVVQLEWLLPQYGAQGVMVEEGLEMSGNLLLLLSLVLYSRYTILDAQGLLTAAANPVKTRRVKESDVETSAPAAKPRAAEAARSAAPLASHMAKAGSATYGASISAGTAKPNSSGGTTNNVGVRVDRPEEHAPHQRLSKAERRALRRQQRSREDDDE